MAVGVVQTPPCMIIDGYSLRIEDEVCLKLIRGVVVRTSSTSGAVTTGSGTTPDLPIIQEATSSGPMEIDTPHENVDMESPVPLPSSPTLPPRFLEPLPSISDGAPLPSHPTRYAWLV
jgi:hypothetical protein